MKTSSKKLLAQVRIIVLIFTTALLGSCQTQISPLGHGAGSHGLAINKGKAFSWGRGQNGELGDGATRDRNRPSQVSGLSNVVSVSPGGGFSLALTADGKVWAWGHNDQGELGVSPSSLNQRPTPSQVPGLSEIIDVAASPSHAVALRADGRVLCWGRNEDGELGSGTKTKFRHTPQVVQGIDNVMAITTTWKGTVALKANGTVWFWGVDWGNISPRRTSQSIQ